MNYPICPICRDNGGRWAVLRKDSDVLIIDGHMREVLRIERICTNKECGYILVQCLPFAGEEAEMAKLGERLMQYDNQKGDE